jgi:hypothetical protein
MFGATDDQSLAGSVFTLLGLTIPAAAAVKAAVEGGKSRELPECNQSADAKTKHESTDDNEIPTDAQSSLEWRMSAHDRQRGTNPN